MTAIGPHDEARAEHVLVTRRAGDSHSGDAISIPHERSHARPVEDFNPSRCRRILQQTVEPCSTRTVLGSCAGKFDVDKGIVLSQPHDVRWRRYRPDCVADSDGIEHVETGRMDSVS
jgi:hypothetical protein